MAKNAPAERTTNRAASLEVADARLEDEFQQMAEGENMLRRSAGDCAQGVIEHLDGSAREKAASAIDGNQLHGDVISGSEFKDGIKIDRIAA